MSEIILNDQNFDKEILESKKPILVDFYASWCNPCLMLTPILEKVADDFKEKLILAKVDLDQAGRVAQKYQVNKIPAVILFIKGEPVDGFIGFRSEDDLREWLEGKL